MKIKDLSIVSNALGELYGKELDGCDAWDVVDIVNTVNEELDKLESIKNKLIDKYAIKDKNNKPKLKILIQNEEIVKNEKGEDVKTVDFGENDKFAEKDLKDLLDKDISLNINPIKKETILKYKIKPAVIGVLRNHNIIV